MPTAQDELDFEALKPYQPRQFVPLNANLQDLEQIKPLYQDLLSRNVSSAKDLEQSLLDRSELEAALDQTGSILYIRMTCQTDDPKRAQAYQEYIEKISPVISELDDQLNRRYLDLLKQYPVDEKRYGIYNRKIKENISLFVKENIPLSTKVSLLSQEYQTICGAMMVQFEGKERTMPEMGKFLLDPDRALREKSWRAVAQRRLKDKDKLEQIFDEMLVLRNQIAKNAGCRNFIEYKFRSLHRFDYTPQECKEYHRSIEEIVIPVWRKVLENRKKEMKLEKLRPWDTSVDPLGRSALKPFAEVHELISGCQKVFAQIDPELGAQFAQMADEHLLDLASRKGKAPGGYQSALQETRKPFIFMNAVGIDGDVRTLLHEGGHAFHSLACSSDPLLDYRHGPMEFNEVASMAMELLANDYLGVFYNAADHERSIKEHLEDVVFILGWVAIVDAFQHWIYENPSHKPQERREAWLTIYKRFGGDLVDWVGLEEEQAYLWHRQLHIFEVPFYYIEYGIAQLGALQVWRNAGKDLKKAVADYRRALALGGSRPLPELYAQAGIRFDFSAQTIRPLMVAVQKELGLA